MPPMIKDGLIKGVCGSRTWPWQALNIPVSHCAITNRNMNKYHLGLINTNSDKRTPKQENLRRRSILGHFLIDLPNAVTGHVAEM